MIGKIEILLEGASLKETERVRSIIHKMIEQGVFGIRRGRATLSFDHNGILGRIDMDIQKWSRDDEIRGTKTILDNSFKNATVE